MFLRRNLNALRVKFLQIWDAKVWHVLRSWFWLRNLESEACRQSQLELLH